MGPLKNTNPQIPCAGKWGFAFLLDRAFVPQTSLSLRAKNCEASYSNGQEKARKTEIGDQSPPVAGKPQSPRASENSRTTAEY